MNGDINKFIHDGKNSNLHNVERWETLKIHSKIPKQWFTAAMVRGTIFYDINSLCFLRLLWGLNIEMHSADIWEFQSHLVINVAENVTRQWVKRVAFRDHKTQWSRNANMKNKSIKRVASWKKSQNMSKVINIYFDSYKHTARDEEDFTIEISTSPDLGSRLEKSFRSYPF